MAQLDLVIRGGTVVDGTGVPHYQADVGIKNGRVARVSGRIQGGGAREIDARGCIVAPGPSISTRTTTPSSTGIPTPRYRAGSA